MVGVIQQVVHSSLSSIFYLERQAPPSFANNCIPCLQFIVLQVMQQAETLLAYFPMLRLSEQKERHCPNIILLHLSGKAQPLLGSYIY